MIRENFYQFSRYPTPDTNRVLFGHTSEELPFERNALVSEIQTAVLPVWYLTLRKLSVFELLSAKIA
jgi:hypothetical protein